MSVGHGIQHRQKHLERVFEIKTFVRQTSCQGRPFDQFHHENRNAGGGGRDLIQPDDGGVIKGLNGCGFPVEAFLSFGVGETRNLEGYRQSVRLPAGSPDRAESAARQPFDFRVALTRGGSGKSGAPNRA